MPHYLKALLGAALAVGAHAAYAQPKPPPEKAPVVQESRPPHVEQRRGVEEALAMCSGCHDAPGYRTAYPDVYSVPRIAGQQPAYIVSALKAYKAGERSHPSMRGIASGLSEQLMEELAAYYGGNGK